MLPARIARVAVELDAEMGMPDPRLDPLAPDLLSRLLADHHERWLRENGMRLEARRIERLKLRTAWTWFRVLNERKAELQAARIAESEPHPDLLRFEIRFRWGMARLRLYVLLHFLGVRGLHRLAAHALRPLVSALRPACEVVEIS